MAASWEAGTHIVIIWQSSIEEERALELLAAKAFFCVTTGIMIQCAQACLSLCSDSKVLSGTSSSPFHHTFGNTL